MKKIYFNKPFVGDEEITAVTNVLKSNWLIAGKEVEKFERNFSRSVGRKYAVAVNSGTAALHLSLITLNIQKADEILIPTYTASDLLNAVFYVGAVPVLLDTMPDSCVVAISQIEKKITKRTKAMIIPHTFGFPVDIPALKKYNIPIVEDCAQSIWSTLQGKRVGAFGDVSIFSFFATKLLTTGQGGMVLTDKKEVYDYIKDLITYNGRDNYKIRYNYPLTDIAASIGNVQLKKYPQFAKRRQEIVKKYQEVLEKKGILHLPNKSQVNVIPFRFLYMCKDSTKQALLEKAFVKNNIEIHQPVSAFELLHTLLGVDAKAFPNAENFVKKYHALPLHAALTNKEVEKIVAVLFEVL